MHEYNELQTGLQVNALVGRIVSILSSHESLNFESPCIVLRDFVPGMEKNQEDRNFFGTFIP